MNSIWVCTRIRSYDMSDRFTSWNWDRTASVKEFRTAAILGFSSITSCRSVNSLVVSW